MKILVFLCLSVNIFALKAQNSLNSGGFDVSTGGGSISASIGQLVNNQYSGNNGFIQEGVQLPIELITLKKENIAAIGWDIYPNPSSGWIFIKSKQPLNQSITVYILDNTGRIMVTENATTDFASINLTPFSAGLYQIKIQAGQTLMGTTQIIKNK